MGDCRQKCWIAGGTAGLLVALALLSGGASIAAALLVGAVACGLLGGLLVWGLCEGRGSAAENAEIHALTWEPEPFTPSRRVVAPGGRVVSTRPLEAEAPLPAAPLDRVTLQPSRDPQQAQPGPVDRPQQDDSAEVRPPSETVTSDSVTVPATPAVASAIPVAPIADTPAPVAAPPRPASPPVAVVAAAEATESDRVATITDPLPEDAPQDRPDDRTPPTEDVQRIKGIGPMIAGWLAENGVTRLDQIAAWDEADISHFAIMMGRGGHRIRAEDWVGQARALTAGQAGGAA